MTAGTYGAGTAITTRSMGSGIAVRFGKAFTPVTLVALGLTGKTVPVKSPAIML